MPTRVAYFEEKSLPYVQTDVYMVNTWMCTKLYSLCSTGRYKKSGSQIMYYGTWL